MTQEELDAAIRKIILPQSKPRSTQNSHYRKIRELRRLKKFIHRIDWHGSSCYYADGLERSWDLTNGRLQKVGRVRRKLHTHQLNKKLQRRCSRRFKGEIPSGAAFRKIPCNQTY